MSQKTPFDGVIFYLVVIASHVCALTPKAQRTFRHALYTLVFFCYTTPSSLNKALMPYILRRDRERLDPFIEQLKNKITGLVSKEYPDGVWPYLAYAGLGIGVGTALDAALQRMGQRRMRYWLVAILDGLYINIARELRRRTGAPPPPLLLCGDFKTFLRNISPPENLRELDYDLDALVKEIGIVARQYHYDGAFVGLCNYVLSTLGGELILRMYEKGFSRTWVSLLAFFWEEVAREFYETLGEPYEDEQIAKEENGDCPVFVAINERLSHVCA